MDTGAHRPRAAVPTTGWKTPPSRPQYPQWISHKMIFSTFFYLPHNRCRRASSTHPQNFLNRRSTGASCSKHPLCAQMYSTPSLSPPASTIRTPASSSFALSARRGSFHHSIIPPSIPTSILNPPPPNYPLPIHKLMGGRAAHTASHPAGPA